MVRKLILVAGLLLVTSSLTAQPPVPADPQLDRSPSASQEESHSRLERLLTPKAQQRSPYPCCDNCLNTWRTCTTNCNGNSTCEASCDITYNHCILACCGSHCPPMYCPL